MDAAKIRVWSLSGENHQIRSALISDQGKQFYDFVKRKGETTSTELSHTLGVSVQHASTVLNRLCNQGYLRRFEAVANTGGYVFVYSALDLLSAQEVQA